MNKASPQAHCAVLTSNARVYAGFLPNHVFGAPRRPIKRMSTARWFIFLRDYFDVPDPISPWLKDCIRHNGLYLWMVLATTTVGNIIRPPILLNKNPALPAVCDVL